MNRFKKTLYILLLTPLLPMINGAFAENHDGSRDASVLVAQSVGQESVDILTNPFPKPPPPATEVRIAVLNASGKPGRAGRIAVVLKEFRRRELEKKIGMKIEVANVSTTKIRPVDKNIVYYRPGFLRAALLIARAIPGQQSVRTMMPDQIRKFGIDVEIVLGGRGL